MMLINRNDLPAPLEPFGGGFYVGLLTCYRQLNALIVSPKAEGQLIGAWGKPGQFVSRADSFDSLSNTIAMAEAGSELAQRVLKLRIGGFDDWSIPARDPNEMLYRFAKPTREDNCCTFRDGENPSSVPVNYQYTPLLPAQCTNSLFQDAGPEAFDESWYWSSTQSSTNHAWVQHFLNGSQDDYLKGYKNRVRAVRTIPVSD